MPEVGANILKLTDICRETDIQPIGGRNVLYGCQWIHTYLQKVKRNKTSKLIVMILCPGSVFQKSSQKSKVFFSFHMCPTQIFKKAMLHWETTLHSNKEKKTRATKVPKCNREHSSRFGRGGYRRGSGERPRVLLWSSTLAVLEPRTFCENQSR